MYFNLEYSDGSLQELTLMEVLDMIKLKGELKATLKFVGGKLLVKIKWED